MATPSQTDALAALDYIWRRHPIVADQCQVAMDFILSKAPPVEPAPDPTSNIAADAADVQLLP